MSAVAGPSSSSASSGVQVTVHPLPILSIAEHHSRTRLNRPSATAPVFGGLLGQLKGREVEIVTSYELAYRRAGEGAMDVEGVDKATSEETDGEVDWAFFEERTASFKQVFPTLDFVGWYTVGSTEPGDRELALHRAILEKNDAALLLLFDPSARATEGEDRDLPLSLFSTSHEGTAGIKLSRVGGWKIESGEAERVAVSSVSQDQFGGSSASVESSLVPNLTTLRNAVQMLASRTQVILAYLAGVSEGTMKRDEEVLRMIGGLMASLPVEEGQDFRDEFETEYADVQLTSYLSTLSKSLLSLNNLTDKFTYLYAPSANDDGLSGASGGFLPSGPGFSTGGGGREGGGSGAGKKMGLRERLSGWR